MRFQFPFGPLFMRIRRLKKKLQNWWNISFLKREIEPKSCFVGFFYQNYLRKISFFPCVLFVMSTKRVVMNRLATSTIISAAALLSGSVPAFAETSALTDLGNVMFVGDSITHGVNSASYRWELHKILVDNGISYNSVGYKTANYSGGVTVGEMYGGVNFNNVHSSEASARAWEIAGRKDGAKVR